MSVPTKADKSLDQARQDIKSAIKALSNILIDECWGHDQYSPEFLEKMNEAFSLLRDIKRKLD